MKRPSTADERMKEDEAALAQLEKEREDALNPPEEEKEPEKPEEKMWKKRHDDGRRYMERMKVEHAAAVKKLEDTIESMRGQIRRSDALPKTEAEVQAYAEENPETFKLLTTVIARQLNEREKEVNEKFAKLEAAKVQTDEEIARRKLESLHDGADGLPTYSELEVSSDFHDWVANQSKAFQHALYEDSTDWKSAHSVIEAYKNTLRVQPKKGSRGKTNADAATMVKPSSAPSTPSGDQSGYLFKESEIKRMTDEEFLSKEAEIEAAGRAGKILMDGTGHR